MSSFGDSIKPEVEYSELIRLSWPERKKLPAGIYVITAQHPTISPGQIAQLIERKSWKDTEIRDGLRLPQYLESYGEIDEGFPNGVYRIRCEPEVMTILKLAQHDWILTKPLAPFEIFVIELPTVVIQATNQIISNAKRFESLGDPLEKARLLRTHGQEVADKLLSLKDAFFELDSAITEALEFVHDVPPSGDLHASIGVSPSGNAIGAQILETVHDAASTSGSETPLTLLSDLRWEALQTMMAVYSPVLADEKEGLSLYTLSKECSPLIEILTSAGGKLADRKGRPVRFDLRYEIVSFATLFDTLSAWWRKRYSVNEFKEARLRFVSSALRIACSGQNEDYLRRYLPKIAPKTLSEIGTERPPRKSRRNILDY